MAGRLLLIGELNDDLTELRIFFETAGLTVEVAPDCLAGLEAGREFQPDLVVTEILTNRLSGFELASRIVNGTAGFSAPVIFYTEFYRDEKARREVLGKYGAIQYLVRPFQKEALKKSVVARFQDFLSSLATAPISERNAEAADTTAEVNPVVPQQLSRAAAAAEKQPGRPVYRSEPGGVPDELPARFRAFSRAAQTPSGDIAEPERQAVETVAEQSGSPSPAVAGTMVAPQVADAPAKDSKPRDRGLLLTVEEPSWTGRVLQSTSVRVAAFVLLAALALYLARDWFQSGHKEVSTTPSETSRLEQPSPSTQAVVPPTALPASPPVAVPAEATPQEPNVQASLKTAKELAKPLTPSSAEEGTNKDLVGKNDTTNPSIAAREPRPTVSIRDVTGSGNGPTLRKMKPIQLSSDMLNSLAAKAVVVRLVIDNTGRVTEVTPLSQEGATVSLPAEVLAAIQQWQFSRSRRKDAGEAVKYFSLKVQSPR